MDKEKLKKIGNLILEKMKTTRILGIVGVIIIFIGLLLPFMTYEVLGWESSLQYIQGDGQIVLVLCILTTVLIYSDIIAANWPRGQKLFSKLTSPKITLIPSIISIIVLIVTTVNNFNSDYGDYTLSIGYFVIWIGLIATVAYAFLYKKTNDNIDKE